MNQERLAKVYESMKAEGVGQFLVTDPMAVYYLTGTMLNCGERMMVLLLAEGQEPKLVIGKLFPQNEEALGAQVIYFEDTDDYVGILASEMSEDGVIGVDKVWPARFLLALMDKMPSAKFVNASYIIDHIRQIKTADEQEKMRAASACNDKSMGELIPLVVKGMTEKEMGEELLKIYLKNGAQGHSFDPIVAYGDNAADPHHEPDDSKGVYGNAVVLDIG